jgi:energy-coupling factor transporter ATP-binding protein EcfA2
MCTRNGYHEHRDLALRAELTEVTELQKLLGKRTQELSKGQHQRTIVAFSPPYGS